MKENNSSFDKSMRELKIAGIVFLFFLALYAFAAADGV